MPSRKINGKDPGKWAEAQAEDWLDAQSDARASFAYHRYPDARAARGALAAQPADYLIGCIDNTGRRTIHLEVKETAEKNRLPKAKIGQFGRLLKFHWAGFETFVLVYRSLYSDWVVFNSRHLFDDTDVTSFPWPSTASYPTAAAALQKVFS